MDYIPGDPNNRYSVKGIRSLSFRFDQVKIEGQYFTFFISDMEVGRLLQHSLDNKTRSKLTSLSEWEGGQG
jgi:hypothetical protein